jgi:Ni,Fe-hydrogenase I small subunit
VADAAKIRAGGTRTPSAISEIDILWITAGLGCDGDTIATTAATQPSLEDVVLGSMPWIPKVHFHNPFLAIENGDEFLARFHLAAEGKLSPFILVVEGSIPNENNKEEGYWASMGTDSKTGQPITTCQWIDWLAPRAWAVVAAGTCATYGGIHAMEGNPTGCMGLADYLGWQWKSTADIPIVCVPGCPVQPDNFMETLLYLLYMYQCSKVSASKTSEGQYWAALQGELSLRGVTRNQLISARVTVNGDSLRAAGDFSIRQSDYDITPVTAAGGAIRLKDELKFTFEIVARKLA